ncbi:hypothetical protein [Micromonospora eburnea]|uniref:Uncharacterized protein n=1 Tax=Micromonospora eburnea TaxID=227316 RepID=A0A1C6UVM0_9ACTN|nr:hypothetical protein [Micromonospora eburnea]SCL58048.1 hypothetical protein GA0070604_3751 [Micromonospora eburnea]
MRTARLAAPLAALLAVAASPGVAHAATITQPFHADSGDACAYGVTDGTLDWRYGTSPLPLSGVTVSGTLTDQPVPSGPATCPDDRYFSTATYIAYSGAVEVDRQTQGADNSVTKVSFTLGDNNSTSRGIDRIVIQVCRSPIITLPPSYCGKPTTYLAPPVA